MDNCFYLYSQIFTRNESNHSFMTNVFVFILIPIVSVLPLFLAISTLLKFIRIKNNGIATTATVVDIVSRVNSRYNTYDIIVHFKDLGNREIKGIPKNATTSGHNYKFHEKLPVIYNQDDPKEFVINRIRERIVGPAYLILFSAGLLMISCSMILHILSKR